MNEQQQVTSTSSIYFAVPDSYTIGVEFDTYEQAYAEAEKRVRPIEGTDSWTRSFIDIRLRDEQGDRVLSRVEVQIGETLKTVRRSQVAQPVRFHRFNVGDEIRHADDAEQGATMEVAELTWRKVGGSLFPTYTLVALPGTVDQGDEVDDVLDTDDLVLPKAAV